MKASFLTGATAALSIALGLGCIDVNVIQSSGAGGSGGPGVGGHAGSAGADGGPPAAACEPTGPKKTAGTACLCDGDCISGFCVENVCCGSPCTSGCTTCSLAGSTGTCVYRTAGANPRNSNDCPLEAPTTCGLDGTCDGSGNCRHYYGTTCLGGACNGDAVVGVYTCDGTGQCKPGVTTLCQPYGCDPTRGACFVSCTENSQCGDQVCDFATESCGRAGPGATCGRDDDCLSGFCADGSCCNVACTGACVSCSLPGRLGTCWPIDAGAPDPRGVCTDQGAPSCGHDGTCDGMGGCADYRQDVQCLAPSCAGNRLNTAGTCDGSGTCRPPGELDCHPFSCVQGACSTSCQTNGDCDMQSACVNHTCGPGPLGHGCTNGSECASSYCVDGVCCESPCTGACRSCDLPSSPGYCANIAATNIDTRGVCSDQGSASCGNNGRCNGSGGCASYAPGTLCSGETCANGIYTPPSTCSANGQCTAPDSQPCAPYVCNGTACFDACATNDQCRASNSCVADSCGPKGLGASCRAAAECESGFCAQGTCCNGACSGACQSCALTNSLGTCTSVAVGGSDPQGACRDTGSSSCGTNGRCDGKGSCQEYARGTTCRGSTCPSGTTMFTAASTCDGVGNCVTPNPINCSPSRCGGSFCLSSCSSNVDCVPPAVCTGGSCGLKGDGQICATGAECSSGFCAQGTCCDSSCQGACRSCALTRSLGACTNVADGASDPQGTCQDAGTASCGTDGFCDGNGTCRLYASGTSCAAPVCAAGSSTLISGRSCDGNGTCRPATSVACAPFLCNGSTACKTACAGDADCLSPVICDPKTNLCGN